MEMHQIRYFLAVSRTLNFTRAAEECNVAQPSLTRAIKLLEDELGGELFRRERTHSHLTDLGQRMLPFLRQSYEGAVAARELAKSVKRGAVQPLKLVLSRTVPLDLFVDHLIEVQRAFRGLELKLLRADARDLIEMMKKGDADLMLSGPLAEDWERFDHWKLFTERQTLVVGHVHAFFGRNQISLDALKDARILFRPYCEQAAQLTAALDQHGIRESAYHNISSDADLVALAKAGVGVGFLPERFRLPPDVGRVAVADIDLSRAVSLTTVAGRPRNPAAAALISLLRAADWTQGGV
ncbi:MAG: LysR family transcriptional regulator [Hyphomicrobiaceae bacterium]